MFLLLFGFCLGVENIMSEGYNLYSSAIKEGRIVAFGDFNNDRINDVVVLDHFNTLSIYLRDSLSFTKHASINNLNPVQNVYCADFNQDGFLDLAVLLDLESGLLLKLYIGGSHLFESSSEIHLNNIQPFIADNFGKLEPVFNGYLKDSKDLSAITVDKNGKFIVLETNLYDKLNNISACFLSTPHSSAFLDFDGDCAAGFMKLN